MKVCVGCGIEDEQGICLKCWQDTNDFADTITGSKKRFIYNAMRNDDRYKIYKKCKDKDRKFTLKFIRNYFNWARYEGIRKDGKRYYLKF